MPAYNTEEIIKASMDNVEALNKKLNDIEQLHNQIKKSIEDSAKIPGLFDQLGNQLNESTEKYLSGNNEVFKDRINDIISKTKQLQEEITRLEQVDFSVPFQELEKKFIENTRLELNKEFTKLDEKIIKLKTISDDLKNEVDRLTKIDLESHFEKHQNKLSEVFNAINGINGILTTLSQNVIKVTQQLGDIEQQLKDNQAQLIENFQFLKTTLEKQDNAITILTKQNQELNATVEKHAKKQQIFTYITWAIIMLSIILAQL